MGFLNSNACPFSCLITFANPATLHTVCMCVHMCMSSENPEIRHPSIPDSARRCRTSEHARTNNIVTSAGEEEKVGKSIDEVLVTKITSTKIGQRWNHKKTR
jgi:hypothetical protein